MSASSPLSESPSPSMAMVRSLPQGVDELSSMGPFDLFMTQMESGSTEAKVDAMKRLGIVAYAMGKDPVLANLVPYLQTLSMKQPPPEDELLLLLAKQVRTFAPGLLHTHKDMLALVPILERLAAVEETVVRDEAVSGMNHVCQQFLGGPGGSAQVEPFVSQSLVAMSKRLVGADWFTAKVSAAGMLPKVYEVTRHGEIPHLYKELCMDETPMVRRSASQHLGELLATIGGNKNEKANELMPVLQQLCKDEQDSVRMLAVASLAKVGASYSKSPEWTKEYFLPIVKDGSTDMSWRVRHNLAKHFSDLAVNLGFQGNSRYASDQSLVMACFVSLLTDAEAEVRAAAVGHFARMVHWGGAYLFQTHLLPLLPALADDVVMEVRSKCALALMESSEGGTLEDGVILQSFGPLLESFLQDEFQEVQLQVLGNLHKLSRLLHGMNGVVSTILNMSKATNWRVREGVAKLLPHLCQARGVEFFSSVLLEPAWLVLLLDPVASVRSACVGGMPVLVGTAGQEWVSQHIVPQHVRIYNHAANNSYLVRITILRAHASTAVSCSQGAGGGSAASASGTTLWNDVVLQMLRGLNDKVANVRMVAALGIGHIIAATNAVGDTQQQAVVQAQITPALEKRLQEEDDLDCRAAYTLALQGGALPPQMANSG